MRTRKQLTATQAADRLSAMLCSREGRIHAAQAKATLKARIAVLASDKEEWDETYALTPESERPKIAKVLLALGHELSGFEAGGENDTAPVADAPPVSDAAEGEHQVSGRGTVPDEVPERLRTPLSDARLALGKSR